MFHVCEASGDKVRNPKKLQSIKHMLNVYMQQEEDLVLNGGGCWLCLHWLLTLAATMGRSGGRGLGNLRAGSSRWRRGSAGELARCVLQQLLPLRAPRASSRLPSCPTPPACPALPALQTTRTT